MYVLFSLTTLSKSKMLVDMLNQLVANLLACRAVSAWLSSKIMNEA